MNILLTNDDGYKSDGIRILYQTLSREHNVCISAPASQKSAVGHGITLGKPMKFHPIEGGYAIEGTPADCIKVALYGFFSDTKFDLVVAGINNGANLGNDVFYSGTVAGAREGLMNDIPSIACSINRPATLKQIEAAAQIIRKVVSALGSTPINEKFILNINFPSQAEFNGIQLTHLGKRVYNEVICFEDKEGMSYASVVVDDGISFISKEGSDIDCIQTGCVSITPMTNEYFVPFFVSKISTLVNELNKENFKL